MKMKVYARGEASIDLDPEYEEPAIRAAIEAGGDVGSVIIGHTPARTAEGLVWHLYELLAGGS